VGCIVRAFARPCSALKKYKELFKAYGKLNFGGLQTAVLLQFAAPHLACAPEEGAGCGVRLTFAKKGKRRLIGLR
jgi:hypothetical protein